MKYKEYSAEDFANDTFFIRWVKNPDKESDWFWQSFMKENPACVPAITQARELVALFEFERYNIPPDEVDRMRNHLMMQLYAEKVTDEEYEPLDTLVVHKKRRRRLLMAAAISIPILCAGLLVFLRPPERKTLSRNEATPVQVEEKVSRKDQKSLLFLSDGTKIWVNGLSKVTYAKDFTDKDSRDVYLEGEAFFDVAHGEKPFIVHTSSIRIKVLGTAFNVKSYETEKTIETTLVRGKVRIEQSDIKGNRIGDIELKPNQKAVFDKESKIIDIREVVAEKSAAWRQDRLVFDEEPIERVLDQLGRWFGVTIKVENETKLDCKLTATIEKESLEDVLRLLELSHGIHYTIEGKTVLLEGEFCMD